MNEKKIDKTDVDKKLALEVGVGALTRERQISALNNCAMIDVRSLMTLTSSAPTSQPALSRLTMIDDGLGFRSQI